MKDFKANVLDTEGIVEQLRLTDGVEVAIFTYQLTKKNFNELTEEELEDCTFDAQCDRVFEYSDVHADICGHIENIKNPSSGRIVADSIGSITINENVKAPNDCVITIRQ